MAKQGEDILMRLSAETVELRFSKKDKVKLRLGGEGEITWLAENGQRGEESLAQLRQLHNNYKELSAANAYKRIGVEYAHDNKNHAFLAEIVNISFNKSGKPVITATIEEDYEDRKGEIDHQDITGAAFRKLHNRHKPTKEKMSIDNATIHIDTWSHKELTKEIGHGELISRHDLVASSPSEDALQTIYSLEQISLTSPRPASQDQSLGASLSMLSWDKAFNLRGSDASLELKADITPSISASIYTPDSLWQYLDENQYSFDIAIDLDLNVNATLNTGTDSGSYPLFSTTIQGPSYYQPIYSILSAQVSSGIDVSGEAIVPGLKSSYTLGASQRLGFSSNVSLGGITNSTSNSSADISVPSFDPITGIGLKATASPNIALGIGVMVPDSVPFFGGDSLAAISGTLSLPITFTIETGESTSALIGIAGAYDAGIEALTFLPGGGLKTSLASGDFFIWKSDNLLA